ncbi:MAG: bifunctional DNA primase/polymerase, partial [Pseudomonadota bacterium]
MTVQDDPLLEAALSYLQAGISVLPCELPNKNPAFRFLPRDEGGKPVWEPWTRAPVTEDEVRGWFDHPSPPTALGIIGGAISGNLEIIDIDDADLVKPWADQVKELDPALFARLVVERTMRGRCHVLYRCEAPVPGSQKLAVGSLDEKHKALVETKAEGGYVVAAPSPGYRILKGDLEQLPVITAQERADLIQISRSFTRASVVTDAPAPTGDRSPGIDGDRPGDEFNRSGDWRAVLTAHGWQCIRRHGEEEGWRRPGKDRGGISATWNHVPNAFYVFSTGAHLLEDGHAYSPFALLTTLDFDGDYSESARALRRENKGPGSWPQDAPPPPGDGDAPGYVDREGPPPGPSPAAAEAVAEEPPPPPEPPAYLRVVPPNPNAIERPALHAGQDDLAKIIDQAWAALEAANHPPKLFHVGTSVAAVIHDSGGLTVLEHQTAHAMREQMARAARWYSWKPGSKKNDPPERKDAKAPLDVAQCLVAGDPRNLPPLNRTISAPIMAPSGRIVDQAGYDKETRTYYVPAGLEVPPVPQHPTWPEIETARDLLVEDLIGDFPFLEVGDGPEDRLRSPDRANALGMFILPFARELIQGPTPLHLIEKPTPGSGASLIFQVLGRLVSGADPAIITEASTEDEWRKRVTSTLMKSPEIIAFDNIRRRLDSSALAAALTADVWEDRLLGVSSNVRIPIRNVWMATGNNPAVSNEIARRCVSIRIDSRMEKPWDRGPDAFKHPKLILWAMQNRPQLICAVLTLLRAWDDEGRPSGDETLGSYENWAAVIGGVLQVACVGGFLKNRAKFYERADQETTDWR